MFTLATERAAHAPAIERLLDAAFGPERWQKTCQRLRDGRMSRADLSLVALSGDTLIGTVRLWPVLAGDRAILLVGDAPYYGRFGFTADLTRGLVLPGPVDRVRFLARELVPGALIGATGLVTPADLPLDRQLAA